MRAAPTPSKTTEFLVLRKTPFGENSFIVAGVSPQEGRMTLRMGAPTSRRTSGAGAFDLFQLLQVEYTQKGDIGSARQYTILRDFSAVALHRDSFEAACFLARFTLENLLHLSMPAYTQALLVALDRLAHPVETLPPEGILTAAALSFLNENGVLSPVDLTPREAAQCQMLLEMASGAAEPLPLSREVWNALWQWTWGRLLEAEAKVPESAFTPRT
jgi:recombinational DNA repair protein (RecF pathway)